LSQVSLYKDNSPKSACDIDYWLFKSVWTVIWGTAILESSNRATLIQAGSCCVRHFSATDCFEMYQSAHPCAIAGLWRLSKKSKLE
jgi:hypothetical protein